MEEMKPNAMLRYIEGFPIPARITLPSNGDVGDTADGTYGRKIESPVARVVDPAI
jgi:hypothetical protein